MGFDVDKYKKFHEKRVLNGDARYIKLEDGETRVRILPSINEEELFFFEYFQHYIDGKYVICPERTESIDSKCPICDLVRGLYATNDEHDKELATKSRCRAKYIFNAVVRGKEKEDGIKLLQTGKKLWGKILNAVVNPEIGDVTNIKDGFDIIIRKKIVAGYPNYDDSDIARKSTPLYGDMNTIKELIKTRIVLSEQIKVMSFDEIKALASGEDVTEPAAKVEETVDATPVANTKEEAPKSTETVSESKQSSNSADDDDFMKELSAMSEIVK